MAGSHLAGTSIVYRAQGRGRTALLARDQRIRRAKLLPQSLQNMNAHRPSVLEVVVVCRRNDSFVSRASLAKTHALL